MTRPTLIVALLCGTLLAGPGCGAGGDQNVDAAAPLDGGADELDREGCEHLIEGPFVDVVAGVDAAGAAEVKADHHAYRVALAAGQAGFVKYAAAAAVDHVFFFDANVAVAVLDDTGAGVAIEASVTSVTACTAVQAKHTVPLPAVGTYYLRLGPAATAATVTIVVEEAEHHHG